MPSCAALWRNSLKKLRLDKKKLEVLTVTEGPLKFSELSKYKFSLVSGLEIKLLENKFRTLDLENTWSQFSKSDLNLIVDPSGNIPHVT